MLDVLVFTDCTSEESLSGSPGFQFLAHSLGTTPTDESTAKQQQHLLPTSLPDGDWAEHPETCAYFSSGSRMYLSRGHSTGATIGGRLGNQLTVTVMTSDPYDILPLRPAQLFSSPNWDLTRPTSREVPAWDTPVQISEDFDVPGLHALVTQDSWAASMLPQFLTMLDQTQAERRRRLLIRHPDQKIVMRWVSLFSHFLAAERALRLDFRVFTDAPLNANQAIVGVHPALAPDVTVERASREGVNLIDLEKRELTAVEPTESAIRYARWFLNGDPYEALEAIEVGRRWSAYMDADAAALSAELATMGASPSHADGALIASLTALRSLAVAGQTDELDAYGDALADVVVSSPPTKSADLLLLDSALWSIADVGDIDLSQSLATAALEWAAVDPTMFASWCASFRQKTHLEWRNEGLRDHAASLLASALVSADASTLPDAFLLAGALNTGVSAESIAVPIRILAAVWANDSRLTSRAPSWEQSADVTAELERQLDRRLTQLDPIAIHSFHAGSWDWLIPSPSTAPSAHPMSRWLALRELRSADAALRSDVLQRVQISLPSSAWQVALTTAEGLDPEEVANWIKAHGDLDPVLAREIERVLADVGKHPRWKRANGAPIVLHQIDKLRTGVPPTLMKLAGAQKRILSLFKQGTESRNEPVNAALRQLHRERPAILNDLYGDWIARAVLESQDSVAATALAEGRGQSAVIAFTREKLEQQLRAPTEGAMHAAIRLLDPSLKPWDAAAADCLHSVWDDKSMAATREWLLSSVEQRLTRQQRDWLDGFLETQTKGRFTRGVVRGAKSMLSGRDKKN